MAQIDIKLISSSLVQTPTQGITSIFASGSNTSPTLHLKDVNDVIHNIGSGGGGTGPQGPTGPQGNQGNQGPTGPAGSGTSQDLQDTLSNGNDASGSIGLTNDLTSGRTGFHFFGAPSYNHTASLYLDNGANLNIVGGNVVLARYEQGVAPQGYGYNVLQAFTASAGVQFPNIPNSAQDYVLGYNSTTKQVTYYSTSSFVSSSMGPQGAQGPIGPAGPQGNQGNQGPIGAAGPQGIAGPQGNQGNQGATGITGPQGNQGPLGPQGAQGNQGPIGTQGNQGNQGPIGPQGNQGADGAASNVAGPQGNQGPVGPQGGAGSQNLQDTLTNGDEASGSIRLRNDLSSGRTGFHFYGAPTYNHSASFYLDNGGNLNTTIGNNIYERVNVNGTQILGHLTASDDVQFSNISNTIQDYILGYNSGTGDVTYFSTSSLITSASGTDLSIYDEGTLVRSSVAGINFTGTGVIATTSGSNGIDVTISAGSGPVGPQGVAGPQGAQGNQGPEGPASNVVGPQGNQGPQGSNGATGAQGNQGATGATGSQGNQGNQGPLGPQGNQGRQGPEGPASNIAGPTGPQGTQGNQGPIGAQGNQGNQGPIGATGPQGVAGPQGFQGNQGPTGITGPQGNQGPLGPEGPASNVAGPTGPQGNQGPLGPQGAEGAASNVAGPTGPQGNQGPLGPEGPASNVAGPQGPTGPQGSEGAASNVAGPQGNQGGLGPAGPQGAQGPTGPSSQAGISTVYSNTIRYTVTSSNDHLQVLSAGTVYGGVSWNRSSSTLNITSSGHSLSSGDFVVVRNVNEDYIYKEITVIDANHFSVTVANSGDLTGTAGAYIPAFDIAAISDTAITLNAPGAGDVQLISFSAYIDSSETDPKTITVPSNAITNGAGANSALQNRVPPDVRAYNVGGSQSSWLTNTVVQFSTSTNHNVYSLSGGLDTFGPIIVTAQF